MGFSKATHSVGKQYGFLVVTEVSLFSDPSNGRIVFAKCVHPVDGKECGNMVQYPFTYLSRGAVNRCKPCGRRQKSEIGRRTQILSVEKRLYGVTSAEVQKVAKPTVGPQRILGVMDAIDTGAHTAKQIRNATGRTYEEVGDALAGLWDQNEVYSQVIKGERHWFRKSVHVVKEGPVSSLATVAAAGFFHGADCRRVA